MNTNSRPVQLGLLLGTIALLLLASTAVASSTITLRAAVRMPADQSHVRLADIATLEGEASDRYGDVIVADLRNTVGVLEIPLRAIREALEEAGVHWGRTHLNGSAVVVRRTAPSSSPPLAMAPAAIEAASKVQKRQRNEEEEQQRITAAAIREQPTLRGAIADYLIHTLHVAPDHLHVTFDQRQEDILNTGQNDYRFEIEPASSLESNRIDLVIRFWRDSTVERRETISVTPLIYRPVVTLARRIDRGSTITESDLEVKRHWLSPGHPGLVTDSSHAIGRIAAIRLREGDMLRSQHVRRETLIRRGEQVIVRCIVGNTVISVQAEARQDGGKEDTIELRKFGERETFLATVTGPNEAVVDLRR